MENQVIKLTSGISKYYKKCFLLDEDALRRIQGILENAGNKLNEPFLVVFYVRREDDRFYEVSNVDDVLSDPNIIGKRVTEISIELRTETARAERIQRDWIARVFFVRERKYPGDFSWLISDRHEAQIQIASQDRNWALLLADELEPQVLRTFKPKGTPRWLLILFVIPFTFLLPKLSQLLSAEITRVIFAFIGFLSVILLIMVFINETSLPPFIARFLGPESSFLWGEEIQYFRNREQLRTNIMWVIIIGFIISVISSGIFYFY